MHLHHLRSARSMCKLCFLHKNWHSKYCLEILNLILLNMDLILGWQFISVGCLTTAKMIPENWNFNSWIPSWKLGQFFDLLDFAPRNLRYICHMSLVARKTTPLIILHLSFGVIMMKLRAQEVFGEHIQIYPCRSIYFSWKFRFNDLTHCYASSMENRRFTFINFSLPANIFLDMSITLSLDL